ncbi:MAG: BTAD domain-containing putative transcriptional regulator [Miltoncostaeaceae bacterium]
MVEIHLIGGVRAEGDDGRPLDVGPAKCQAVLAALALSAGSPVSVARLVELVWGVDPPRTAEKTLQTYVGRLRRGLRVGIVRVGATYRLDIDPAAIDVLRFERRLDAGDIAGALAEWGDGEPLAGLGAEGLAPSAERLAERRLEAIEADLLRRADDDPAGVVGALTELTARNPYRERLWALLMTALYRSGRPADALAAFRRARSHMVDELGIEPGPRLRELEAMVLANDAGLGGVVVARRTRPPEVAEDQMPALGDMPRGNLPRRAERLIGRDEDLAAVATALAADPVVTLVGPGGIGKTRLAVAAARAAEPDMAGGAWLVPLADISSADDVARAVADVLGIRENRGRALDRSVVAALEDRHALLLLDNCEHVAEAAAALARAVAEMCPHARVLATSREPLGVAAERLVPVGPLEPHGAAAELFAERASAADPSFDAAAAHDDVVEICRRLDGLPLAIELASARLRSLTARELRERLDDALRLLGGGRRPAMAHHRTLRATIGWSYDLLSPPERALLARLSVFAGRFDVTAAEAVAAGGGLHAADVVDILGGLVDRSMVVAAPGAGTRRLRLLETIRAFAAERLAAEGEAEELARRHTEWCRAEIERIGGLLAGPREAEGVAHLAALWPDLRAAIDRACARGDRAVAVALVAPVAAETLLRCQAEIGDWVERILAITPQADAETEAFCLAWAAQRRLLIQDHAGWDRLVERRGEPGHPLVRHARAFLYEDYPALLEATPPAVAELRRQGRHHAAEFYEIDIGAALLNLGRLDELDRAVGVLADRYRAQGPPTFLNWTLLLLGYSALFAGDRARAEHLFDEAVAVPVPPGTHSPSRAVEAASAFRRGDARRAFSILLTHVEELLAGENMHGADITVVEFVPMLASAGRPVDAARLLGFLEATNLLDAPAFAELVAAERAAADADPGLDAARRGGRSLDARRALSETRALLIGLLDA